MPTLLHEQLARAVCQFLAEMLRTREAGLERAAELAAAIVERLPQITSEELFFAAIRELEFEFQELRRLSAEMQLHAKLSERQQMERLVRDYAAQKLPLEPQATVRLMQEALRPEATLDWMLRKYPDLNQYYHEQRRTN